MSILFKVIWLFFFIFLALIPPQADAKLIFKTVEIEGWQINFDQGLVDGHSDLIIRIRNELQTRLAEIEHILPAKRVEELRRIPIYVQARNPFAVLYYGNGGGKINKDDPTLNGRVVIGNAAKFLSNIHEVPSRVLHELAHGFHNQILGLDNPDIQNAFDNAVASHLYEKVRDYKGYIHAKSYARTNKSEYFALLTQAYYLRSGFFPFTRDQLEKYDPQGFELVRKVWEDREGPQPALRLQAAVSDDSCSSSQFLKSIEGVDPVQFTIRNASNVPLILWWMSYSGERKIFVEIPANGFYKQQSFSTHVWGLDNQESGNCVGEFQLGTLGIHIDVS